MKRLFFLPILIFFCVSPVFAQKAGTWQTHFSYTNAISQIEQADDLTYVLTDGKLFSYSKSDQQTEIYVNETGNNDIVKIAYNRKNNCLLIFRDNADIDLMYSGGQIKSIHDLRDTNQNIDKTLNSIFMDGDDAYLATNFGLLVLDLSKAEIAETAIFKIPFYSICIYQGAFYAATQNGVLTTDTSNNILDINNWVQFPVSTKYDYVNYKFQDSEIRTLGVYKDKLHFLVPQKAIYILESPNRLGVTLDDHYPQTMIILNNDRMLAFKNSAFWNFTGLGKYQTTLVDGLQYVTTDKDNSNQYWAGIDGSNLSLIKTGDSQAYEYVESKIKPDGPLSNFPFYLTYDRGSLMFTGGGFNYDNLNNPARLSVMTNDKWFNYSKSDIDSKIGGGFSSRDFTTVVADPADINHLYVTSWGDGVYEFKDQSFVERYTPDNTSGVLEDIYGAEGYVRMNGMCYDTKGNLWFTNAMVENPIKVLQKNGQWTKLYYPEIANDKITNDQNLMIDRFGNKWMITTKTGTAPPYIFIFNDKGTLADTSDDSKKYISTFVDQDGNRLNIATINQTTEDLDGNIWVSTDIGPLIIYNSANIFDRNLVFYTIKVPRNDGTNQADILLDNVPINKIAVDGANRKWIATRSSGVYLVSDNGNEMLYNFNTENSPMPSNNVLSLAIDSQTGVVYIGTDKGLVSFASDATAGKDQFSDVHVYPNPVRPDYNGVITVTGLKANSTVKITDINAHIIAQGQSLGGSFTWNGENITGRKVATGVYLVLATAEDGSTGVVTKIMVIK